MSYYQQYPTRKDRKTKRTGAKAADRACRNNGSCPYCRDNRTYSSSHRSPVDSRGRVMHDMTSSFDE